MWPLISCLCKCNWAELCTCLVLARPTKCDVDHLEEPIVGLNDVGPCKLPMVQRTSVIPILMPHRQAVQRFPVELPLRHEAVHQRDEAGVVGRLQQVHHLVNDDVFEALARLLGQVGVEPDAARTMGCSFPIWSSSAARRTAPPSRPSAAPIWRSAAARPA